MGIKNPWSPNEAPAQTIRPPFQLEVQMNPQFLSPIELAHALKISLSTVYRLKAAKVPPFNAYFQVGRRILFPASLLEDLEKKALSTSGSTEAHYETAET
jgi:hypothetical protein